MEIRVDLSKIVMILCETEFFGIITSSHTLLDQIIWIKCLLIIFLLVIMISFFS